MNYNPLLRALATLHEDYRLDYMLLEGDRAEAAYNRLKVIEDLEEALTRELAVETAVKPGAATGEVDP